MYVCKCMCVFYCTFVTCLWQKVLHYVKKLGDEQKKMKSETRTRGRIRREEVNISDKLTSISEKSCQVKGHRENI